jgi:hypothetical protein
MAGGQGIKMSRHRGAGISWGVSFGLWSSSLIFRQFELEIGWILSWPTSGRLDPMKMDVALTGSDI